MFGQGSRYVSLTVKTLESIDADGQPRQIRYVERRFLPPAGSGQTALEHVVVQGDRLDNITAKYLGDPTQFWRIADANGVMQPEEITEEVGRRIRITLSL
jgi:nucleoid-associated protein YgaU